jgi:hypothetical protein
MVRVPGAVRPFSRVLVMSNMKIIAIMDAENRAQSAAIEQDIHTALAIVEDEIDGARTSLQHQIDELKQRVKKLEGG